MKDKSASSDFVSANAREMDSAIVNKHIQLYVNEYSLSLGTGGREAINGLFRIANEKGVIPPLPQRIFLIQ